MSGDILGSLLRLIYDIEDRYPRMCSEIAHEHGGSSLPDIVMHYYRNGMNSKLYDICIDFQSWVDRITIDAGTMRRIELYCKLVATLEGACNC